MNASDVRFDISAQDNASGVFSRLGDVIKSTGGPVDELKAKLDRGSDGVEAMRSRLEGLGGLAPAIGGLAAAIGLFSFAGMIKGAIDGVAALEQLHEKTGASVEALSGLVAVGKQSGTSADAIADGMNKLAKSTAMVGDDGKRAAQALRALGIDFDSFQAMTPDEKMVAVAKAMDNFGDGSGKSAAAMALLGKSGAELLPFMHDLAETGQLQTKVTTEQAAEAKEFERSLRSLQAGGEAWKKELAMGMLPALADIGKATAELFNGTGGLREQIKKLAADGTLADWARGAFTAFTYLIDVGQGLFSLLPMLGKVIAGVAAGTSELFGGIFEAVNRLKSGDVSGAWDALKSGFAGVKTVATQTGNDIADIWGQKLLGQQLRDRVDDLKNVTRAHQDLKPQVDLAAAAVDKHKDSMDKARNAGIELIAALEKKNAEVQREIDLGRKLSDSDKALIDLQEKLRTGKVSMTDAEVAHAKQVIADTAALQANAQWLEETGKANDKAYDALAKHVQAIEDQVRKQNDATRAMGLTGQALVDHSNALLEDRRQIALRNAAQQDDINLNMAQKYRDEAEALGKLQQANQTAFDKKAALEAQTAWAGIFGNLSNGLYEALSHGFNSAWDFVKKTAAETVLKLTVMPLIQQGVGIVGALVGNALGIPSMTAGASLLGTANNVSSAYSMYGALTGYSGGVNTLAGLFGAGSTAGASGASLAYANAVSATGGDGLGALIAANGSWGGVAAGATGAELGGAAIGAEAAGGAAATEGALASAGPYGWIAAAVVAVIAMLYKDGGGTPHVGGYALAGSDGSLQDITKQQGGIQNDTLQEAVGGFAKGVVGLFNDTAKLFGKDSPIAAVRSVFESDNNDPSWGLFHLLDKSGNKVGGFDALGTLDSDPAKGFAQYSDQAAGAIRDVLVKMDLPKWVQDTLSKLGDAPTFKDLSTSLGAIEQAQKALIDMGASFEPLGGVFAKISGLSSDAKFQLVEFAGGLDALKAKTASYVKNYYSKDEQMALTAQDVIHQLAAVGITDVGGATGRGDLRTLMESLDPSTEQGRKQMVALLNVQDEYAGVGDYLTKSGLTLGELAGKGPANSAGLAALASATDTAKATQETAAATAATATSTAATASSVADVAKTTADAAAMQTSANELMVGLLQSIDARLNKIEADIGLVASQ